MSKRVMMGRRDDLLGPQEELWQIKMLMLKYEHGNDQWWIYWLLPSLRRPDGL